MAHKLGPGGAAQVLAAAATKPSTSMTSILDSIDPKAAAQNPGWAKQNVGQFVATNTNKYGAMPVQGINPTTQTAPTTPVQRANLPTPPVQVTQAPGTAGYQGPPPQPGFQPTPAPTVAPPIIPAGAPPGSAQQPTNIPLAQGPAATGPTQLPTTPIPGAIPGPPVVPKPQEQQFERQMSIAKPQMDLDVKQIQENREAVQKNASDLANVAAIQDYLPRVQTGWTGETKLEAGRILKGIGASDQQVNDFLGTDVASGQLLQKKFLELSMAAARGMGAREPGSVIQMFSKAYPGIGTDPQAIMLQTNAIRMDRIRQQDYLNDKEQFLQQSMNQFDQSGRYRGLTGFQSGFDTAAPPENYLHAAESMSVLQDKKTGQITPESQKMAGAAWKAASNDPNKEHAIYSLIPSGSRFVAPDGSVRIKP
jgi:hypothetical protein